MKKAVIIILGLIISSFMMFAQESDCMEQVKKMYAKTKDFDKNAMGEKAYVMHFSITTTPHDWMEVEPYTANIEYTISKNLTIFKTRGIEVYEGKKETITVLSLNRTVVLTNTAQKDYKKRQNYFNMMQDSIFQYCYVTDCKKVRLDNGTTLKKVKMKVSEEGQKKLSVLSMIFYLDIDKESVYQYRMFFTDDYEIDNAKVVFNKIDHDYKSPDLAKPVKYFVFHNNVLRPEYKGYELIDKRKSN